MAEPDAVGLAVELGFAVELEVAPLVSGNIAGVGREACPGRLAEEPGIAAEKRAHDSVIGPQPGNGLGTVAEKREVEMAIVSQLETEVGSIAQKKGVRLAIVWMTPAGSSARLEVEAQVDACPVAVVQSEVLVEACPVAAAQPGDHGYDKLYATEAYHT